MNEIGAAGYEAKEEAENGVLVDRAFAAIHNRIRSQRKQCNLNLDRMDGDKDGTTLTDFLFQIFSAQKVIEESVLNRMKLFFIQNDYDSDCIEMDLEDVDDSNIRALFDNKMILEMMAKFIHHITCMSRCVPFDIRAMFDNKMILEMWPSG